MLSSVFGLGAFGFIEYAGLDPGSSSPSSVVTPPGRTFVVPANGRPLRAVATKTAQEDLDFALDWSALLDGDVIASSTWGLSLPGAAITQNYTAKGTLSTVWLAGGAPGNFYDVTNTITTAAGREESATFQLEIVASNYV